MPEVVASKRLHAWFRKREPEAEEGDLSSASFLEEKPRTVVFGGYALVVEATEAVPSVYTLVSPVYTY